MTIVELDKAFRSKKQTVVCLGLFDGVHIGHQALVTRARGIANEKRLMVCAHTFDEMPARVLRPGVDILELTPLPEKAALLAALGVDTVAVSPFDGTMMRMRAEDFFFAILLTKLRAEHLVIGVDHRFGFRAQGGAETLRGLCAKAGVGLDIVPPVTLANGEAVSSTAIRGHLRAGDTAAAEAMLGRPWRRNLDNIILREE